ncbi:MAG: hypothetical protein WEB85_10535 [Dongiaceae bacterium]
MDFDDLVTALAPPPNRLGKTDGDHEIHLYEWAVTVAYATHLLRGRQTDEVRIHLDGEHGKLRYCWLTLAPRFLDGFEQRENVLRWYLHRR